ncbi:MAG TPA: Gfo/Idh/MocA family oxidoreductase [Phycisphaeraceae bacterium]
MLRLGVIGLGLRASHMVRAMRNADPELHVAAVADPDGEAALQRLRQMNLGDNGTLTCQTAEQLLEQADRLDGLLIGTRCHLHTPLAVQVAGTGLPLFLEKPVAIDAEQLQALNQAYRGKEDQVVVSFPLRVTPLFRTVLEIVRSGRLGKINQVQAINNVNYGGVYFGNWYRNYDQVGGLWLQKATHDFDYINHLLGQTPLTIAAMSTQGVYGGDRPFDLRCSACDQTQSCPESPRNQALRGDTGGMKKDDHWCAFSQGIRNQDAGSAILLYSPGLHASYTQNFITRRGAHRRGAIITGYHATLEFDWATDSITIHDHHDHRVDRITVKPTGGHSGGDAALVTSFVKLMRREEPGSYANLRDGLISAAICLAARESVLTQTFQPIVPPWQSASDHPTVQMTAV